MPITSSSISRSAVSRLAGGKVLLESFLGVGPYGRSWRSGPAPPRPEGLCSVSGGSGNHLKATMGNANTHGLDQRRVPGGERAGGYGAALPAHIPFDGGMASPPGPGATGGGSAAPTGGGGAGLSGHGHGSVNEVIFVTVREFYFDFVKKISAASPVGTKHKDKKLRIIIRCRNIFLIAITTVSSSAENRY